MTEEKAKEELAALKEKYQGKYYYIDSNKIEIYDEKDKIIPKPRRIEAYYKVRKFKISGFYNCYNIEGIVDVIDIETSNTKIADTKIRYSKELPIFAKPVCMDCFKDENEISAKEYNRIKKIVVDGLDNILTTRYTDNI